VQRILRKEADKTEAKNLLFLPRSGLRSSISGFTDSEKKGKRSMDKAQSSNTLILRKTGAKNIAAH